MKPIQSAISNRYLYTPAQSLRKSQLMSQYRAYDKVTKRDLLMQIHQKSDLILDSLREHKHAFILFLFDRVQLQDSRIAYLFESCVQTTLQEALQKITHLNQEDALVVFKYILLMVSQVHSKQLIAERLCLSNILVCNYALFKLGHLILQSDLPLQYWSPQRLQQKQVTFQSDVFSLGVMLYKMLYGVYPFRADNAAEMAKKIKGKKFQSAETTSPLGIVISREVHYLVLSMLDYYEQNRPDIATILSNSCFSFDIETDMQKYLKPKGSIVPQSFHKKYLVYRPAKIITKYSCYFSESSYLVFNTIEKTFMTLYTPEIKMFQAQPRKIESYLEKVKALQKSNKKSGCEYLLRVDDVQKFRQQPIVATEYCNQGNLYAYLEKRKVFKGWLSQEETNVVMYLLAIGLKQMKEIGISSLHTISHQRIMISNNNIKLRQPGILTPMIQKILSLNQQIDFFAPQLKQKMDFVQLDKTDIWSYGIMYIYLLSGQMPRLDEQNHIDLSGLKTSKKNVNVIGKCLDYNVKKRSQLSAIKMDNVDEKLLQKMIVERKQHYNQDNDNAENEQQEMDADQLLDQSDIDSNHQQIKDNKKVMFKRRKERLFKNYNKIISQSTTSPCRLIIKSCCGLIILWLVFFGLFFLNGGVGLLRTNFYRKITVQVPYNYGTTLYNMTILSTNGALISSQYGDYSYQQFTIDLKCAQNQYSPKYTTELWNFANGSQSVYCLFGFIYAIMISILYMIQVYKLDLPSIMYKRKKSLSNKELYHFVVINFIIPSLMFTFFYVFAFEYIVQMTPCFGIENLAYPKFTSVDAILNGNMGVFFLNVFLTVILWGILMFFYGFGSIFWKKISLNMYQWVGIVPTLCVMFVFTLISRVGFGTNVPIQPTWTYKMNLDITSRYFGLFGFFPEILWVGIVLLQILIDFVFWIFLKIGLTPQQEENITRVAVVKARFQRVDTKDKDLHNQKNNIYLIENSYEFQRFD